MTMIDPTEMGLEDSQEPYAVEGGEEHKLRIVEVKDGTDKNGLGYLQPRLEILGEPFAKDFTHFLHLPDKSKMDDKKLNRVRFAYKSFCKCFGIDMSRLHDPKDEWPGHEGFAILGLSEDDQYGEQNFIKKLITPQA